MHCARHRVELGIVRARRFAEASRGRRKLVPEAIEIDTLSAGHHYGMIARKVGCHGRPHVTGLAITVKQHDGGPGAAGAHIYRGAVGRYIMCAEFRRKVESVHDDLHVARSAPTDKVEPRVQGSGLTLLCQKAEKWARIDGPIGMRAMKRAGQGDAP